MAIEKVGSNIIFQKKVMDVSDGSSSENTINQEKKSPLKAIQEENKGVTINTKV